MDGQNDGWMDGWTNGWDRMMDGWTDGWMDGWTVYYSRCHNYYLFIRPNMVILKYKSNYIK
jgi:hypothetical protein